MVWSDNERQLRWIRLLLYGTFPIINNFDMKCLQDWIMPFWTSLFPLNWIKVKPSVLLALGLIQIRCFLFDPPLDPAYFYSQCRWMCIQRCSVSVESELGWWLWLQLFLYRQLRTVQLYLQVRLYVQRTVLKKIED